MRLRSRVRFLFGDNMWSFFEIISAEAIRALIEYQYKHYGTKLDKPVMHFKARSSALA